MFVGERPSQFKIDDNDELFLWYGLLMKGVYCLISSRDHSQRSSPSLISDSPVAGFEPAQNLSSGFVEWSYGAVITPRLWIKLPVFKIKKCSQLYNNFLSVEVLGILFLRLNEIKHSKIHCTKNEVFIKDFFSKCDQIRSFLRIWFHLLKKWKTSFFVQ